MSLFIEFEAAFYLIMLPLILFFFLHSLLHFFLLLLAGIYLILLHQSSSTNDLRMRSELSTRVSFYPSFAIKYLLTFLYAFFFFGLVVFYSPELFNHSVSYIAATLLLLVTSNHIVP